MKNDDLPGNANVQTSAEQAAAWRNRDIVEAHRVARREGDKRMQDILEGAAEITLRRHMDTCTVEDCQTCEGGRIVFELRERRAP